MPPGFQKHLRDKGNRMDGLEAGKPITHGGWIEQENQSHTEGRVKAEASALRKE